MREGEERRGEERRGEERRRGGEEGRRAGGQAGRRAGGEEERRAGGQEGGVACTSTVSSSEPSRQEARSTRAVLKVHMRRSVAMPTYYIVRHIMHYIVHYMIRSVAMPT